MSLERDPERASLEPLHTDHDLPTHDPNAIDLNKPADIKKEIKFKKKKGISIEPIKYS